jgi:hypothetical protein
MTCTARYATVQDFIDFWCLDPKCEDEKHKIEMSLDIAAADIWANIASVGACDCTLAPWAAVFLRKLNVIDGMVNHSCPCNRIYISGELNINADEIMEWRDWMDEQFTLIRTGKIELCADATGSQYPAMTWAQQSLTDWNSARIVLNDQLRNS